MRQVSVERRHFVFGDGILETLEGGILCGFGCCWIRESEDVLGEREERVFGV